MTAKETSVVLGFSTMTHQGQEVPTPVIAATGARIAHVRDCSINSPLEGVATMTFTVVLPYDKENPPT
jgi:hypothetical protein